MFFKKKIDLVILAGGKGSRIKKFLKNYPKPMIKVNNKHFLNYILKNACSFNFEKAFILTGYRSKIIFNKYHKKVFNFVKLFCIEEKKEMGTGGALFNLKKKLNDFILINGDTFFDIDYKNLVNLNNRKSIGNIALTKNKEQKSLKLNSISIKNGLLSYSKKSPFMNGGVYFFKKKFLNFIPNKKCSLENEILPELIKKKKIEGKKFSNFFLDIGSKEKLKSSPKLIKKNLKRPSVFLDRDGVINHDYGYVHSFAKFKFKKGVIKGLKYLTKKNFHIFIVTNQAGIGKGKFTYKSFEKLHKSLKLIFIMNNIKISDVEFSPFHPNAKLIRYKKKSNTRKPGNLMIENILKNWDVEKKESFMIGDQKKDFLAAKKSKLRFFYAEKDFFKQIKRIVNSY